MPSALIRGADCVYEVTGTGPPLILIHSIGLSTRQGWRAQVPVLARTHRVVTYDIRGLGESAAGAERLGVATFAADLAGLMDHLSLPRAALMGVSLGGFIAQAFAIANPDRVSALVLVSTACRIAAGNSGARAQRNARIRAEGMGVAAGPQLESHFSGAFRTAHPEIMDWYRGHYCANDPAHYTAIMEDLGTFDCCDRLGAIRCPTLVVAGAADAGAVAGRVPLESAKALCARIPGARLEIIEDAHHYPQIEQAEAFNRAVAAFLHRPAGEGA
ncbi:MAG: alpha/beta hydrolase [Alphaproteobacteria bacterium]|nr:alpha/beta hydrolase [Alphaproteobacteria bacterium]